MQITAACALHEGADSESGALMHRQVYEIFEELAKSTTYASALALILCFRERSLDSLDPFVIDDG